MIIFGVLFVCVFSIITVANLKLQLVTNAADAILATVAFIYGQQLCHLLLLNLNTMLLALACWTLLRMILLAQTVDTLSFQELQEIGIVYNKLKNFLNEVIDKAKAQQTIADEESVQPQGE